MFSDTTLNRIYDRGSFVYNYSLGGEGFTKQARELVQEVIDEVING